MNERANELNAAFMEVTYRKVETQDKKITALGNQMKIVAGNEQLLHEILTTIDALRNSVNNSMFP